MAAIAFSGKLTLTGGLPWLGTVIRIVDDLVRCRNAPVFSLGLYGARSLGALLIGPAALGGSVDLELAGGGTSRAISPVSPRCSELTSGLADESMVLAIGLVAMRERAEILGGTLRVIPLESGGTLVQLRIPRERVELHGE